MSDEEDLQVGDNTQLLLIMGESGSGKSASLMNIPEQEKWLYENCEAGKRLPFKNKFNIDVVTDPYTILENMKMAIEQPDACNGIITDTVTFLMEMFESVYIVGSNNTQKAWGMYQQYWKELMQQHVAKLKIPVIMLGHTHTVTDANTGDSVTSIPVKGALRTNGLEAYFSTAVSAKKKTIKDLKDYENDMLHITEDEELVGFKHVFQTRITKQTVGEKIRAPLGMFSRSETYIDNDAWQLLQHMNKYYN